MPVVKKNGQKNERKTIPKYNKFKFVLILLSLGMFFYPAFFRGLYFEDEQFPAQIIYLVVFCLYFVYKLLISDKKFICTPIDYLALAMLTIYGVSIFWAVNTRMATSEFLKYSMYFVAFYIVSDLFREYKYKKMLIWNLIFSAVGVSIISIDAAIGAGINPSIASPIGPIGEFINKILQFCGLKQSIFDVFIQGKIYSTFQYSNAFAIFVVAVALLAVGIMLSEKGKLAFIGSGFCAFILMNTSFYAYSRGVILILPIILLLFVVFMPSHVRIKAIGYLCSILLSCGVLFAIGYPKWMSQSAGQATLIWSITIFGGIIAVFFAYLFNYFVGFLSEIRSKTYTYILGLVAILGIIIGVMTFNVTTPLVLSHKPGSGDNIHMQRKTVSLNPGNDYILRYTYKADMKEDKQYAYYISILNKTLSDILSQKNGTELIFYPEKASDSIKTNEIQFKVPSNSRVVNIDFGNYFENTGVTFYSAEVLNKQDRAIVSRLKLKHKYLPTMVAQRFEDFTSSRSYIERSVFMNDAIKMLSDYWMLGGGGGLWATLYTKYQSYSYKSTQTHNYPLQIFLETGIIGLIVWILLIISIPLMFFTEYRKYKNENLSERIMQSTIFVSIIALIIHSSFDFDFSLSAVFLIFWQLTGLFNNRYREEVTGTNREYSSKLWNKILEFCSLVTYKLKNINVWLVVPILAGVLLMIVPINLYKAKVYQEKSLMYIKNSNINSAISLIKEAISLDPFNPSYASEYLTYLTDFTAKDTSDVELAKRLITKNTSLTKYNPDTTREFAVAQFRLGNIEDSLDLFERYVNLKPQATSSWDIYSTVFYSAIIQIQNMGDKNNKIDYNKKRMDLSEKALSAISRVAQLNKTSLVPFVFENSTIMNFQKILFIKENPQIWSSCTNLAYYTMRNMDVDSNTIPDEFTPATQNTKVYNSGRNIIIESDKWSKIDILKPNWKAGEKYILSIVTGKDTNKNFEAVVSGKTELKPSLSWDEKSNTYYAEFTVPSGKEQSEPDWFFNVNGKIEIKNIMLMRRK